MITEQALYEIIQDTWAATLGVHLDRRVGAETSEIGSLTVCARISGAWEGEVCLQCTPALARLFAAAIFQVEADLITTNEIFDALSELIHIVGGNLKALLPQPVFLSLPTLAAPAGQPRIPVQHQTICRLTLVSEGHPFEVTLSSGASATSHEPVSDNRERQMAIERV